MPTSRTKHVTGQASSVKTYPPAVGYVQQSSPLPGNRSRFDTLPRNKPSRESVIANKRLPGDNAPKAKTTTKKLSGWKQPLNKRNKQNYGGI